MNRVAIAVRSGNFNVAGAIINYGLTKGGYGFNFLHEEALLKKKVINNY